MADFDAIVVGGGIAGCCAAYELAKGGAEVLLVERSSSCGSKNLSGGVLYGTVLADAFPNFWDDAPYERLVNRNAIMFLGKQDALTMDYFKKANADLPANGVTVLRARLDAWLSEQAENEGAALVNDIKVDSLIVEGGAVKGIVAGGEEMTANVVILADGITSFLARSIGMVGELDPKKMGVGVKHLIELGEDVINERFNLNGNEGVSYGILGEATAGQPGGVFLYTNKTTVSVGTVMHIDHLTETGVSAHELLDQILEHPAIEPLLRGGKLVEYGAHMVCEGGLGNVPARLSGDGVLIAGDAAGFAANNGFVVRGMDMAAKSGLLAAETALAAIKAEDFSAEKLGEYDRTIQESYIMEDMTAYKSAPELMKDANLYTAVPQLVLGLFDDIFTEDSQPKSNIGDYLKRNLKSNPLGLVQFAKLGMKAVKNL